MKSLVVVTVPLLFLCTTPGNAGFTVFERHKASIARLLQKRTRAEKIDWTYLENNLTPYIHVVTNDPHNSTQFWGNGYQPSETRVEGPNTESCLHKPAHWSITPRYGPTVIFANFSRLAQFQHPNGTAKLYTWLQANNICRRYCMRALDFRQQLKWTFLQIIMKNISREMIWTSGRICDFGECKHKDDREYLKVNGWFWTTVRRNLTPTNSTPEGWLRQPWFGGNSKVPSQPDSNPQRQCLGVIKSPLYERSPHWFSLSCARRGHVLCEEQVP